MKIFFLNEATDTKDTSVKYFTESETNQEILKFENSLLESEITYQAFLQEAILTEAQLLLEAKENTDETKEKKKFRENIANFFKKMVEWFSKMISEISKFLNNTVQALITKLVKARNNSKTNTLIDDDTKVKVKFNYPSLTPDKLKNLISEYESCMKKYATSDLHFVKMTKALSSEKAETKEYTGRDVKDFLMGSHSLANSVNENGIRAVKDAKEGLRKAKISYREAKKLKINQDILKEYKEEIIGFSTKIKIINNLNSAAIRISNHISNVFLRKSYITEINKKDKDENVKVSEEFRDAVKSDNILLVRIMLKDSLILDPTAVSFAIEENYVKKNMKAPLYVEHDGEEFNLDQDEWDKKYMDSQMVKLVRNFSHERIKHLKDIVRKLHPDKKK